MLRGRPAVRHGISGSPGLAGTFKRPALCRRVDLPSAAVYLQRMLSRVQRTLPAGFIAPCLPTKATAAAFRRAVAA